MLSLKADLAIDDDIPRPVVDLVARFVPDLRLVPLEDVDPALAELDDAALVGAVAAAGLDGLVTAQPSIGRDPRVLAALLRSRLLLCVVEGVGHDPLRIAGALLLDLPAAVERRNPAASQLVRFHPRRPRPVDAWTAFRAAARRRGEDPATLLRQLGGDPGDQSDPDGRSGDGGGGEAGGTG